MNSEDGLKSGARFHFEQRASTALYNIVSAHPVGRPFLLPANICPIVPLVLCKAGHSFEFIDIDPDTLCLNHREIIARWTQGPMEPAGLIYVRSYGAIVEADRLFALIKLLSPQALIIDDRCLCPPDFCDLIPDHTDAILFSTGYAKYVDIGFGGFTLLRRGISYQRSQLPFDPEDLASLVDQYTTCLASQQRLEYRDSEWLDTRKPSMAWADYRAQVERECERMTVLKSQINAIYTADLPTSIQFSSLFQRWRFNIHVENKAEIMNTIREMGLFSSGHYATTTTLFGQGAAPYAESLCRHVINLFNDRYFDLDRARKLTELLNDLKLTPSMWAA